VIRAVLFDFGGVLTEGGRRGFVQRILAELYHKQPDGIDIEDLHGDLRRGKTGSEAFFTTLDKRYGGHVTPAQFVARTHEATHPSTVVYELAARLRKHGIRTGILSNVFGMSADMLRKEGHYDDFDPVLLSCDLGFAKPDPEIYQIAIERLGLSPEEILLIDDQEKCLAGADHHGLKTICAISPQQIVADTEACIRRENGLDMHT